MIRRELSDGTMLLIPQEDHADVSAQFAAHWGNADFSTPNPFQSVVFATVYHDSGHREVEAATPVDVELGTLYGMRDMPAAFKREEANQANVHWVAARDPYAGLLAAMHRTGLRKRRYDTVRSLRGDYATAPTTDEPLGRENAFDDLDDVLREHLAGLDEPNRRGLWFNYQLLQVYDLLSLHVCCDGYDAGSLIGATLEGVPVTYAGADGVEVRLTATGASSLRVEPYPFDVAPLTISVRGRRMAPVNATSESEIRESYYRAPRELASWHFES